MTRRIVLAACALAVAPTLAAHAGVIRSDRSDALYRTLAAQPEFDSVGRFNWNEPGGSFLGSGVLISDEWVLTAGHVVGGTDDRGAGVTNLRFEVGGATVFADQWIPHPNWALSGGEANLFAGWDLGLVRLDRAVTNVEPASLFLDRDELGQQATLVGFGATGTGLTGATGPSGTKRAGNNTVDVVGGAQSGGSDARFRFSHDRLIAVDFDQPGVAGQSTLGSTAALNLEYLTAPGDSGGGLFLTDAEGQQRVAGITSLGSSTDGDGVNSDYGDRASFTRVSGFVDWIELTTGIDFTAPPIEPGDFNADGVVNAADFALWQNQFGLAGPSLAADGNGDGVVDAADYTVWRNVAAPSARIGAGIPEPATLAAVLPGILACFARRRG